MKRIEGAGSGLVARVALRLARRKTRQIAGAATERMIEPLEAYAHLPSLILGYGALVEATAYGSRAIVERFRASTASTSAPRSPRGRA